MVYVTMFSWADLSLYIRPCFPLKMEAWDHPQAHSKINIRNQKRKLTIIIKRSKIPLSGF